MTEEVVGYLPVCPDCGAVGRAVRMSEAARLVEGHNKMHGHSAKVEPVSEEDERTREEAMAGA